MSRKQEAILAGRTRGRPVNPKERLTASSELLVSIQKWIASVGVGRREGRGARFPGYGGARWRRTQDGADVAAGGHRFSRPRGSPVHPRDRRHEDSDGGARKRRHAITIPPGSGPRGGPPGHPW
jgi:hypothetical protein